jgi:7-cyano-7-deazaguanine synthase in queuosine biosynthesis
MSARVVLAMSGGVDSSVAAYLLKQQGYEVIGLFMRTGVHGEDNETTPAHKKGCCSALDAGDARRVADRLNIPSTPSISKPILNGSSTTSPTSTLPAGRRIRAWSATTG